MFNATKCPKQFSQISLSDSISVLHVLAACAILLAVCAIVSNFTLIVALCRQWRRSTGRSSKFSSQVLIISLASCDVLLGFVSMPLGAYMIANDGHFELGLEMCLAYVWLDKVLSSVSIYHVTSIALDRYIAACAPLVYRSRSAKKVYAIVLLCWAAPLAINSGIFYSQWQYKQRDLILCVGANSICLPVSNLRYVIASTSLNFALPLLAIFTLYFLIAKEIFKLKKSSSAFTEISYRTQQIETVAGILGAELVDAADVNIYGVRPSPESQASHRSFPISAVVFGLQDEDPNDKLLEILPEDVVSPESLANQSNTQVRDSPVDKGGRYRLSLNDSMVSYQDLSFILRLRERGSAPHSQEMISAADPLAKIGHESRKAYAIIICVVACSTVCWLPFNIYQFFIVYTNYVLPYWPLTLFTWLGYLHSVMNPVICLFIDYVRQAVSDLFKVRG